MSSVLTNALNRILRWIEQHKPWYVEHLQPGLSVPEIEKILGDIPIQLSPEVYELYQWRNGTTEGDLCRETAWLFENWTFRPLQSAIARWQRHNSINTQSYSRRDWRPHNFRFGAFSIFYNKGDCEEGFIWTNTNLRFCPVIFENFKGGGWAVLQKYTSLTCMMLTMAECYETGAYYHDPAAYDRFFISCNPKHTHQIWRKYNSDLVELPLQILQQGPLSSELLMYVSDDIIEFKDSRAVELLIKAIQISTHQNSDPIENTYIKKEAARILGELSDARAVPALIALLKDDYYYVTRAYAAKALGQLRDEQATAALIEALTDSESEVRQTAAWALGQIKDLLAAKPLIDALQDSDSQVTEAAREALAQLVLKSPELGNIIPF